MSVRFGVLYLLPLLAAVVLLSPPSVASTQDAPNPFVEMAKSLFLETGAAGGKDGDGGPGGLGSILQGFMEGGAGKQIGKGIGDMLTDPQVLQSVMSAFSGMGGSGDKAGGGKGLESVLGSLLPLLLQQQGHEHHDEPELEDEAGHRRFDTLTSMFQPILAYAWETFRATDAGRSFWEESGLRETVDLFTDLRGKLKLEPALRSLENPAFRKRWLRSLVNFVASYVKHISNPETHKRYMVQAALWINGILKTLGHPESEMFQPGRPLEDSLVRVVNTVARKQMGLTVNSAKYIHPAARYLKDLMAIAQSKIPISREVEDRLAETLNREVIEGILRVWRAYKYSAQVPTCDMYLLCELNRPSYHVGYVVRPAVTKAASMVSAWFLSGHTGTPFWRLYNAAVEDYDCPVQFPVDCMGFHDEDIRVTTEYAHIDL